MRIPRTARALLVADSGMGSRLQEFAKRFTEDLRKEYTGSDEGITVTVEPQGEGQEPVLHPVSQEKNNILFAPLSQWEYRRCADIWTVW